METDSETTDKTPGAIARERILTDLQALARDADDLLKVTAGDVSDKVKAARARVNAALERAKDSAEHLRKQGVASAKAAIKNTDTVIRDHPYESIGIAFGLGLLAGVLMRRK